MELHFYSVDRPSHLAGITSATLVVALVSSQCLGRSIWTTNRLVSIYRICNDRLAFHLIVYIPTDRAFALAFSSSSGGASTSAAGRYSSLHPYPADLKLAVGSYSDSSSESNITIIGLSPQFTQEYDTYGNASQPYSEDGTASGSDFVALAKQKTAYPVTKVDFSPASLASKLQASAASGSESREMLASTSDCLRLWDLAGPQEGLQSPKSNFVGRQTPRSSYSLSERSTLTNVRHNRDVRCVGYR